MSEVDRHIQYVSLDPYRFFSSAVAVVPAAGQREAVRDGGRGRRPGRLWHGRLGEHGVETVHGPVDARDLTEGPPRYPVVAAQFLERRGRNADDLPTNHTAAGKSFSANVLVHTRITSLTAS